MNRGIFALLTAILLAGTAQAATTTNLVADFSTYDATELAWATGDPLNADEILGGLAENRWMVAAGVVETNAWGKLVITSSKDKSRAALYTITADQFGGADPNAQLSFDLVNLQNEGFCEVAVFHIQNNGVAGDAVEYDVLGGIGAGAAFVTDGSGIGLQAVGPSDVTMLVSTNIGGLLDNDPIETGYTITFPYNGNDDIVIGFSATGTSAANKAATIDDIVVTTDDEAVLPVTDDNIIAVFDETFVTPDRSFVGISASISGGIGPNINYGSIDTSYGSLLGDARTDKGAYAASSNDNVVVIAVTNTTPGTQVIFDSFNFDIGRRWDNAPDNINVAIGGDISNDPSVTNHTGFTPFAGASPYLSYYDDFDIDLSGLADHTLAYGEVATFTLTFDNPVAFDNPNSVVAIDNVALLGSVIVPTLFVMDPSDELSLSVDEPLGVVTGAVAVSYVEASYMPTNVTVTAVSVVDQSDGGFANATTLPLTLSSPSAVEDILIEFDNGTAGLAVGETATGVVEIVWNEVGSASSSTSTVPVSAMYLEVNQANTIAIFDHTGENASPRLGGLTAKISGYASTSTGRGSTDGTYGSLSGNARTDDGCYQATLNSPVISVSITNNTGYDCTFDSLHFDAAKGWAKGPGTVTVALAGDVTAGNVFTNATELPAFSGNPGDYPDFDVDLTGLADRTLAHGESVQITFTFSDGDVSNMDAISIIDNIALLGSGSDGATLTKAPGGSVLMGVTSSDATLSEVIEMFFEEGDVSNDIEFNGVTFTNESHAGAFSVSGLISGLSTPEVTNEVVTVEFDNTVAALAAGETAAATLRISWNETGLGERVFDVDVSAVRPAEVPEGGVVALFDTDFLVPDAALDGILGEAALGNGFQDEKGSSDGDYGSLASPAAPTGAGCWQANGDNNVITLTVTNKTAGSIELSSFHFDVGRLWDSSPEAFTLAVSGDVTADSELASATALTTVGGNVGDFDDFDVSLTNLTDHILGTGESVVFTFTFEVKPGLEGYSSCIDNLLLKTDLDAFGIWALNMGLTTGINDDPNDNPDGDSMDNLMEYATGSDPLTAGAGAASWQAEENGTNWFYHVHVERTDDATLTFTLDAAGDLSSAVWSDAGLEFVGESAESGGFKSVTNRTDMGTMEFIRVKVDKN